MANTEMEDDDGVSDGVEEVKAGPAYNLDAWGDSESSGPQCSQSNEFCFLCQFQTQSDATEAGDFDLVGSLTTHISSLVEMGHEAPKIVNDVYYIYEKDIRSEIAWTNPDTGAIVRSPGPEWSKKSIRSHLMFSGRWPEMGERYITDIYTASVHRINMGMVDLYTGKLIPEEFEMFCKATDALSRWKKTKPTRRGPTEKPRINRTKKSIAKARAAISAAAN